MATAQFSGQYGHNMTLEVWSDWNRQDTVNNRSTVNLQARLRTNGYASVWGVTAPMTIYVDGTGEIVNASVNIGTNSSLLIFGKDYVVNHDGNGNKTVNISFKVDVNTSGYGSATVSLSIPLPQIHRASDVSASTGTIGSAMTINISRKNSAFTHTVKYSFGSKSGTIATNVGTSCSWTPPADLASVIPNATSGIGGITVDTYSGSTKIGSKSAQLTLNVPTSMTPTLGSITLTDSNAAVKNLLNTANTFAEIVSDIKVAFNSATGIQGSTITGYHAEIVNKNQSINANNGNLGLMKWNGSAQVKAWVTDSRGRSSNAITTNITVLEYFLPTLTFTAIRGDTNQSSDKIVVTRTAKIAPLTIGGVQKNSFKLSFKTAPFGTETFTADTGAGVNDKVTNTLTNSKATLSGTFDIGKSYEVYGVLEDALTSSGTVKAPPVSPEKMVMGMAETAVSFGKYPENTNAVDSDWVFKYKNKDIQHHQLTNNDGRIIQVARNTDMNTIVETGFYCGEALLNRPTASGMQSHTYFRVQRFDTNATWVLQEAIDFYGVLSAYRVKKSGAWTDWQYYAVQNKVAEFTAVNQTKVYTATIPGPYGLSITARRVGNLVNCTINAVINWTNSYTGTAKETVPLGYRPVQEQKITLLGHAGGGTGTQVWATETFADLTYKASGEIAFTIRTKDNPIAFFGSFTWITSDPFPS
ncbi:DUF859 family phage minor structural protein [Streptococcus gallolyticus]|uniref:DUF859 family phage minor structural protein n=1 Tax=Streptococcus gallolyticus TaxID=315405 RepID=UPI002283C432|nr:DUF859 family phage minor structural protein [Streptococcus gallolyticus]MCY7156272.1 DUF859 domain-containing protein [Streptococcus gallolyticus subsp. gallolyticus]